MKVSELLSTRKAWTTKAYARTTLNVKVDPQDPLAVAWCIAGALNKCYSSFIPDQTAAYDRLTATLQKWFLQGKSQTASVSIFNDGSTYEQVLELVTEADV